MKMDMIEKSITQSIGLHFVNLFYNKVPIFHHTTTPPPKKKENRKETKMQNVKNQFWFK